MPGKAVLMLNASGRIVGTGEYDPFGHVNRVFIDVETAHPYGAFVGVFGDFSQAAPNTSLTVDMRVRFDVLDLHRNYDTSGICSGEFDDTVVLLDGATSSELASMTGTHQGLVNSPWVHPADGHLQLSLADAGCTVFYGCQPCTEFFCPPNCNPGCWTDCSTPLFAPTKEETGVVAGTYEYRRYEWGQIPVWTPVRFPGQYYDAETDAFENWNRYYEPITGRYLQLEPMLQGPTYMFTLAKDGHSLPTYAYAFDNPLHYRDQTGLEGAEVLPRLLPAVPPLLPYLAPLAPYLGPPAAAAGGFVIGSQICQMTGGGSYCDPSTWLPNLFPPTPGPNVGANAGGKAMCMQRRYDDKSCDENHKECVYKSFKLRVEQCDLCWRMCQGNGGIWPSGDFWGGTNMCDY